MAIKVYGKVMSGTTALVLAALNEKEVTDYELVDVGKMPDHLAMQSFGQVPVIVDGPLTLFGSRAIARYIAQKFEGQGTALCGSTPVDHALVEQWVEVEGQIFSLAVRSVLSEKYSKMFTGEQLDEAVVLVHVKTLGRVLDAYEARLTNSKYLAGDFFSLADLVHVPHLYALSTIKVLDEVLEGRLQVKSWWEDVSSRPAWQKLSSVVQQELALVRASRK